MNNFKGVYKITSYLLLVVQLLFLFILLYNKVKLGRILYYGDINEENFGFEKYFKILRFLLYSSFGLIFLWCFLTPFAVISNRNLRKEKIAFFPGIPGFVLAMILLFIDPFGIFKWFTN